MNNKGEIQQETLIGIVLLILVAFVFIVFYMKVGIYVTSFGEGGVCKISALAASAKYDLTCIPDVKASPTALKCPRKNIEISDEKTTVAVSGKIDKENVAQSTESIEQLFADEMLECWNKFGKGSIPLFPEAKEDWLSTAAFGSDRTACHICSEIYFDKNDSLKNDFQNIVKSANIYQKLNQKISPEKGTYIESFSNPMAHCQNDFRKNNFSCWTIFEAGITRNGQDVAGQPIANGLVDEISLWISENGKKDSEDPFEPWFGDEKKISRISSLDPDDTYAVVMMRRGFEVCTGDEDEKIELTMFPYVISHTELSNACDVIIS